MESQSWAWGPCSVIVWVFRGEGAPGDLGTGTPGPRFHHFLGFNNYCQSGGKRGNVFLIPSYSIVHGAPGTVASSDCLPGFDSCFSFTFSPIE